MMHMGRVPDGWDAVTYLESRGLGPIHLTIYGHMRLTPNQSRAVANKLWWAKGCKVCGAKRGKPCRGFQRRFRERHEHR